jgi:hypothetical protein
MSQLIEEGYSIRDVLELLSFMHKLPKDFTKFMEMWVHRRGWCSMSCCPQLALDVQGKYCSATSH